MKIAINHKTDAGVHFYFATILSETNYPMCRLIAFSKESLLHQLKEIYGIEISEEDLFNQGLEKLLTNNNIAHAKQKRFYQRSKLFNSDVLTLFRRRVNASLRKFLNRL